MMRVILNTLSQNSIDGRLELDICFLWAASAVDINPLHPSIVTGLSSGVLNRLVV